MHAELTRSTLDAEAGADGLFQECREETRELVAAMERGDLEVVEAQLEVLRRLLRVYDTERRPEQNDGVASRLASLQAVVAGVDDAVRMMRAFTQRQMWLILQSRPALERIVSVSAYDSLPVC